MAGLNFPLQGESQINSKGEYLVKVSGNSQDNYKLACFADDHYFEYDCGLDKTIHKTGDILRFNANLKYGGNPLTGPSDTVKIVLFKPGDDVNHLLSTFDVPDTLNGADQGTPAQEKFEYLYNNNADFYEALL